MRAPLLDDLSTLFSQLNGANNDQDLLGERTRQWLDESGKTVDERREDDLSSIAIDRTSVPDPVLSYLVRYWYTTMGDDCTVFPLPSG